MYADYHAARIRQAELLDRADRQRRARRSIADARTHERIRYRTR